MRIMVIHPGDSFSTSDVYDGLVDGLRANGVEVIESRLDHGLDVFSTAVHLLKEQIDHLPDWATDAFALLAPRIIAQALWLRPDHVIAVTGLKLHYSVPLTLRKNGVPCTLLCTESPYSPLEQEICRFYDHVFTHERAALPLFAGHPSVTYLPHAYNPARHMPGPAESDKAVDLYFVGTAFAERKALLGGVNWSGMCAEIQGAMWDQEAQTLTPELVRSGAVDPWRGVQANADVVCWYRSAAINLNHHRTTTEFGSGEHIGIAAESLGPRAYEIAACGGFQLCDDSRSELGEIFGDSVPTYRYGDSADLERQIRAWLADPVRRSEQAALAQQLVAPHNWSLRAAQLLERIV